MGNHVMVGHLSISHWPTILSHELTMSLPSFQLSPGSLKHEQIGCKWGVSMKLRLVQPFHVTMAQTLMPRKIRGRCGCDTRVSVVSAGFPTKPGTTDTRLGPAQLQPAAAGPLASNGLVPWKSFSASAKIEPPWQRHWIVCCLAVRRFGRQP